MPTQIPCLVIICPLEPFIVIISCRPFTTVVACHFFLSSALGIIAAVSPIITLPYSGTSGLPGPFQFCFLCACCYTNVNYFLINYSSIAQEFLFCQKLMSTFISQEACATSLVPNLPHSSLQATKLQIRSLILNHKFYLAQILLVHKGVQEWRVANSIHGIFSALIMRLPNVLQIRHRLSCRPLWCNCLHQRPQQIHGIQCRCHLGHFLTIDINFCCLRLDCCSWRFCVGLFSNRYRHVRIKSFAS